MRDFFEGFSEDELAARPADGHAVLGLDFDDGFCLVGRYEDNLVLLFARCEGGGGVSPADVTGRYPIVANDDA